ncbi:lipid-A-disaccharide synthase N-terminal domain-containing protein [Paracoccus aestuariivivens]|uniref:Lipid A biosynthesis protein n=1 Tax=Paracoccus aestuariivivens TaxID=1820333 RepID=A0A6L6JG61_9RHOB|nr:lipid-A-disaccharide synthase N-terminal domain-containing protein [Paracoccus aestuariivivens]MTH79577.1 lipid A biosynthesis protein [Paracoccus aestuariivivens]
MTTSNLWLGIGFLGQMLFSARFLVQWITSERQGRSVIPLAFWWLSLAGGVTLLAYAVARRDPVFIIGQASGLVVYLRNLRLIRAETATKATA